MRIGRVLKARARSAEVHGMATAGGSAWREYERRRVRHHARIRRTLIYLIGISSVLVPLVWIAGDELAPGVGPLMAVIVTAGLVKGLWPSRTHVDAWAIGAAGEQRTARSLSRLGPGFFVFHDRRLPGTRANIDHVVVAQAAWR